MRTYLVIPNNDHGGDTYEMLCRALTPLEAVEKVSEHLGVELAVFVQHDDGECGGASWTVRELPFMLNDRGVIPWERSPAFHFDMTAHPEALNEGVEVVGGVQLLCQTFEDTR